MTDQLYLPVHVPIGEVRGVPVANLSAPGLYAGLVDNLLYYVDPGGQVSQVGPGGGSQPAFASFALDFSTPGIENGINTGIVLPEGAYIPYGAGNFAVATAWDGTSPGCSLASTQADLYEGNAWGGVFDLTQADYDYDGNAFSLGNSFGAKVARGGDVEIWIAVASAGSIGTPTGATVGTLEVLFPFWRPS